MRYRGHYCELHQLSWRHLIFRLFSQHHLSSVPANDNSTPPFHLSMLCQWNPVIGKYSLRHDTGTPCAQCVWFSSCLAANLTRSPPISSRPVLRDTLNRKFSVAFSIIGMFSSHAVSTLSIFFCAEITPTVIRWARVAIKTWWSACLRPFHYPITAGADETQWTSVRMWTGRCVHQFTPCLK